LSARPFGKSERVESIEEEYGVSLSLERESRERERAYVNTEVGR